MLDVQLLRLNSLSVTTGFIFAMFLFFLRRIVDVDVVVDIMLLLCDVQRLRPHMYVYAFGVYVKFQFQYVQLYTPGSVF